MSGPNGPKGPSGLNGPDPGGLVLVGRFLDPAEAQMARGMLESEGIECFLVGANANALVPLAFRVRLQVLARDEAAARQLLEEAELSGTPD